MADPASEDRDARVYPSWLAEQEARLVRARREQALTATEPVHVGLALSGGGIRSATFALGVMQAMARKRVLSLVDYLSTVSGGGYAGVFWGGLFIQDQSRAPRASRPAHPDDSPLGKVSPAVSAVPAANSGMPRPPTAASVERCLAQEPGNDSWEVSWLRENGRYLVPSRGSGLLALAILLRNWLSVVLNLLIPATSVFLLVCGLRVIPWQLFARSLGLPHLTQPHLALQLWWSPSVVAPLVLLTAALPFGLAYWLVPNRQPGMRTSTTTFVLQIVTLFVLMPLLLLSRSLLGTDALTATTSRWLPIPIAIVALLLSALALRLYVDWQHASSIAHRRHWLTLSLKNLLVLAAASALFAVIDSLGQTLYAICVHDPARLGRWLSALLAPAAAVAGFGPRLVSFAGQWKPGRAVQVPLNLLLLLGGLAVAGVWLVLAATLAHAYAWHGAVPPGDPGALLAGARDTCRGASCATKMEWDWWFVGVVVLGTTSYLLSQVRPFLNQSSLSTFYAARLVRTFLGASNPLRKALQAQGTADAFDATEPVNGDEICTADYRPHALGGPLHIINVTLNETIDAKTSGEKREGQAMSFALSPAALSVGVVQHAERQPPAAVSGEATKPSEMLVLRDPDARISTPGAFKLFAGQVEADALTIGQWIAISGAAVAPGLGARSSLGAGLLTVLFNLRLGHWWFSGTKPYEDSPDRVRSGKWFAKVGRVLSRGFPVLAHFLDELTIRFHGTARRHWYLSDGGHFENTGCYELLRRGVRVIICTDAGADPDYGFSDIGNLVRRARLDFGARIEFLDASQRAHVLDDDAARSFGSLDELQRASFRGTARSDGRDPHAALAAVTYANGLRGLLILLKPTLTGAEPFDLTDYAAEHATFPQESTADQSFDEAQWESYRKLGDHIASRVFAHDNTRAVEPTKFHPGLLSIDAATLQRLVESAVSRAAASEPADATRTQRTSP